MSDQQLNAALNIGSAATVIGSLAGWLPPIAAALGIIWYCIQIYEWARGRYKEPKK
jgi:hypothetical protein